MGARDFHGAKLFLIGKGRLLVYQRDDKADIPFPDHWDLPGGGREDSETPEECVLRELHEEFAITLPATRLIWKKYYPNWRDDGSQSVFFGGHIADAEIDQICFGDEGQYWQMMDVESYLASSNALTQHQDRLKDVLADAR